MTIHNAKACLHHNHPYLCDAAGDIGTSAAHRDGFASPHCPGIDCLAPGHRFVGCSLDYGHAGDAHVAAIGCGIVFHAVRS